ncbi:murein L,D-transpeptidase, partial [Lacticaseibacillus paracasei]|nr:murein L,D-transpeptidase [Lacticaseibacillus paracasei]
MTVTDNRATLYSDFNWTKKQAATDVMLQTFKSTGKYHNLNGLTYLSLYDKDGNWRGYINQQSITAGVSDGGAWLPANAYTTFTAANVNAYADFNQQKVATSGAGLVNQTVNISGQYHAFGGVVYYSIYDVRGKWLGYVDASQVKTTSSAAGLWLPHDGYLTTTQSGQMIYTNLDSFAGGRTTTANYQRTFRIMGEYKHYNGATYYSLYDGSGNWMGYLNSALGSESKEAQGVWMNYNANVLITASNAALYSSFFNMTRDTSSL